MSPQEASIQSGWQTETPVIEVPGNRFAKVRRRPIDSFYKSGAIPNSLMGPVREAIMKGSDFKVEEFTDEQILDLLRMMDAIVVSQVEEPRVYPIPVCRTCKGTGEADQEVGPKGKKTITKIECPVCEGRGAEQREQGRVYVDEVPFEVKNFIYTYVIGGVDDLESFLAESNGSVESLPERKDVGSKAKRSSRRKG